MNILYQPGTDISAIAWKTLQHAQIQSQFDQTHNTNIKNQENNKKCDTININKVTHSGKKNVKKPKINKILKLLNRDLYFEEKKKRKLNKILYNDKQNKIASYPDCKYFNNEVKNILLYRYIYCIYEEVVEDLNKDPNNNVNDLINKYISKYLIRDDENFDIPINMAESILGPNYEMNKIFKNDINNTFSCMAHFIDFRKSKLFVEYMLSDGLKRFGLTINHLIYPGIPMWLLDVSSIINKHPDLYLIYSTDTRTVDKFLGHVTSIVNLSNLLYIKLEQPAKSNASLILLHLMGIFTADTYNPINRQGIKFPCSVLQKTTFENVKNQLSKLANENRLYDTLTNFISSTIIGVPRATGTNCFNLVIKN